MVGYRLLYMHDLRLVHTMTQSFAFLCVKSMCCIVNTVCFLQHHQTQCNTRIGSHSTLYLCACCVYPISFQDFITTQQTQFKALHHYACMNPAWVHTSLIMYNPAWVHTSLIMYNPAWVHTSLIMYNPAWVHTSLIMYNPAWVHTSLIMYEPSLGYTLLNFS